VLPTHSTPEPWRRDVVLADGSTACIRPIAAVDGPLLAALHARLSTETVRLRYFGAHPRLSADEVARLLAEDGPDHLSLVVERGGELLGVCQYDRIPGSDVAEVAFVVDDTYQGLGIGTLLLEYLASEGRRYGFKRFAADTLFENTQMVQVFRDAGFTQRSRLEAGVIRVVMDISPTPEALSALYERDRRASARSMQRLLRPRSIAVIGASRTRGTVGHELVRNLVAGGFQGPVYPVNPKRSHVNSVPCFPTIANIPGEVDLAIVAVPARAVPGVVEACGRKGVGGLVIVSSHFAEDGIEGAALEREAARLAHSYGMRMVGPNCSGVLNTDPAISMNATFAKDTPIVGNLGFASQSGGLGIAILAEAKKRGIGLSNFVSMGNKADVSGNDLLSWWAEDEATHAGLLYLESFGNPRKFARLARQLSRSKPVIAVKGGRSTVGRRAVCPHPAALASADEAVAALFRQTGVIRVDTIEELFDVAQVVAFQPLGHGLRVAVVSNVGGPAVLAVDACESNGLEVPEFSVELRRRIAEVCPRHGGVSNPIDLGAQASAAMYDQVLELLLACDEVDAVAVNFTPPLVDRTTDQVAAAIVAATDRAMASFVASSSDDGPPRAKRPFAEAVVADPVVAQAAVATPVMAKPVVASLLGADESGQAVLRSAHFPVPSFIYPETAVGALAHALRYAEWRRKPAGTVPELEGVDVNQARRRLPREVINGTEGGIAAGWVSGVAAMDVLAAFGIPVVRTVEVHSPEQAGKFAEEMGGPVALKVLGPVHKSEGGGVQLGLSGHETVVAAYKAMRQSFGGEMTGGLLQPMASSSGVATIVGATQDPAFGPLVVFGLGGPTVEVLGDHVCRLAPLTGTDAWEMVTALPGSALLRGYRGRPAVDVAGLVQVLHRVGRLVEDMPEVAELECNPVIATADGVLVVDVRLRIDPEAARPALEDTRHLR
jgi:acyl-CoA synthetase (NDP forming)/GNAT superfamily N-acetyltransferase